MVREFRGHPVWARQDFMPRKARSEHAAWDAGGAVVLYVNHNRWVADCGECGAGIAADPQDSSVTCFGCGAAFRVDVPKGWHQAVRILESRPVQNRHWRGESLNELRAENIEHGFPADKD